MTTPPSADGMAGACCDIMELAIQISMYVLACILLLAGIIGCVLPYPGHLCVLLGLVCYAVGLDASGLGWWIWVFLSLLAIAGMLADNVTTMMGAKRFGCSKPAIWGSFIGLFIGSLFFPIGLLLGPFLGALAAEVIIARRDLKASSYASFGAVLGVLAGVLLKLVIVAVMVLWFIIHVHVYGSGVQSLLGIPY